MKNFKRITVTAALPYANGPLHIGHLSGAYLPSDIYVKYQKLRKKDVIFVCGSDEHGVAITIRAMKEGLTPQQIVDKYHHLLQDTFQKMHIDFDIYHRTSSELHHQTAQDFFKKLYDNQIFIEKENNQYFDNEKQIFLADRYIVGTCPKCGYENAYGDQCEKCGTSLSPDDLINPKSSLSNSTPVKLPTKHWYLPLNEFQDKITQYIESHQDWKNNVYGQCKSWLNDGLQPRAITRDLDWGIPVPVSDAQGKVLYVWFDAPLGYISATKALLPNDWKKYWQDPETKLVHFIGKDNIVFHCIIFPIMLMAHGDYILPDQVPANEFLNLEGKKLSTSRNWAVWVHEYIQDFPDKIDVLRYVLTATLPENKDNDFTWKEFQQRNDSELADIYGNFVNRVTTLLHKYYQGHIPSANELQSIDIQALEDCKKAVQAMGQSIENFRFRDALTEMLKIARIGNKYLMDKEPWKTIKTDSFLTQTTLYVSTQITACLAIASQPFLPETFLKLQKILNLPSYDFENFWNESSIFEIIPSGHLIGETFILFEKIPDEIIENQIKKLHQPSEKTMIVKEFKNPIVYEDFDKVDLRIGTIMQAVKVPKADKLLQLTIDDGLKERTIVSGIAQHFEPQDLVNKKVVFVANLEPRKLRGILSEGMLLTAEDSEGKLHLICPAGEPNNGSLVK